MSTASSRWNDERVDFLKRLWCQGLSASQIAAKLGGVSRNAVIGKVHRLGLSRLEKEESIEGVEIFFEHAVADVANENLAVPLRTDSQEHLSPPAHTYEYEPLGISAHIVEKTDQTVSLMELNAQMCRWPLDDSMGKTFRFCGQPVDHGTPYCLDHGRVAYQPSSEKKRLQRLWSRR